MATLRDNDFSDTGVSLEMNFSPSEFYLTDPPEVYEWVKCELVFNFGDKLPAIRVESQGGMFYEYSEFTKRLCEVANFKLAEYEFDPMEPDFSFKVNHIGIGKYIPKDCFEVICSIDIAGAFGGVYCGSGPAVMLEVNSKSMLQFADSIDRELRTSKFKSKRSGNKLLGK